MKFYISGIIAIAIGILLGQGFFEAMRLAAKWL